MTKNQIEYAKLLEQRRSNREQEKLTRRRDATSRELGLGNLQLGYATLGESQRHNLASESVALGQLKETGRHNLETELLASLEQLEKQRHNVAVEHETARANKAGEAERRRSNLAQEALSQANLQETIRYHDLVHLVDMGKLENEIAKTEITKQHYERQDAETERSHKAQELETKMHNWRTYLELVRNNKAILREEWRSNVAKETETNRANLAREALQSYQNGLATSKEIRGWLTDIVGIATDVVDTLIRAVDKGMDISDALRQFAFKQS